MRRSHNQNGWWINTSFQTFHMLCWMLANERNEEEEDEESR
jgi:hypothetical protein